MDSKDVAHDLAMQYLKRNPQESESPVELAKQYTEIVRDIEAVLKEAKKKWTTV